MRRLAFFYVALLIVVSGCATTSKQPTLSAQQSREMGEKCLAAGETADALRCLTEAAEKKPNDAVIQYDLGLAYDKRGLQDKALAHLQNALKIKPDYPEALNAMGSIYATRGQFELARGAFQKVLDDPFYKTPQYAAYNLGRLYEKRGDTEQALAYYQRAVNLDQNYGIAWLRIGQISEQLLRNDQARHAYGNAVRVSPNMAEALLRFGILSYDAGDLEAALHSLSRVGEIAPNTDMADDARRYLEKVEASLNKKTRARSPHTPPVETGIIPDEGPPQGQIHEDLPSNQQLNLSPAPQMENAVSKTAVVPDEKSPPARGSVAEGPELQSYQYMVQIGSFVDREKAEELRSRLEGKGYSAVLRTLKHPELGKVFVIQLQPVNSVSKATTLMTQLGSEIEGEPKIIKIPVRK